LEAESEIIAGFHIEYSGMKFAMFMMAEFVGTLFMSGLFAVVYLGGYRFFGLETIVTPGGFALGRLLGMIVFFVKTFLIFFIFVWIRGTFPRFRIDQMLNFNWKFLVPVSLALILTVAVLDKLLPVDTNVYVRAGAHLVSNLLLGLVTLEILRRSARQRRLAQEATRMHGPVSTEDERQPEVAPGAVAAH